jgi:hypothetical protein
MFFTFYECDEKDSDLKGIVQKKNLKFQKKCNTGRDLAAINVPYDGKMQRSRYQHLLWPHSTSIPAMFSLLRLALKTQQRAHN